MRDENEVRRAAAGEALGAQQIQALEELAGRVSLLDAMTANAATMDVVLLPLKGRDAKRWETEALQRGEDWVFLTSSGGPEILATDEPSEDGMRDQAAAVVYPELHSRLVSWWLVHAWRSIDLLQDTSENLQRWRITSGAVTSRALLEEAGSLADEARKLADAWKVGKAAPPDPIKRPETVRNALAPVLLQAGSDLASRAVTRSCRPRTF